LAALLMAALAISSLIDLYLPPIVGICYKAALICGLVALWV
jgi:hypothetical protein